jgi:hypothetical protein
LHLCLWNEKKFCKALVCAPFRFLITQKGTKNEEDMGVESLELIFSKNLKQTISPPLPVFCAFLFYFDTQRTFVALQFTHPMTQKLFNLVWETQNTSQ